MTNIPSIVAAKLTGSIYQCEECRFETNDVDQLDEIRDITQRVCEGEIMMSGECPKCGAGIGCPDCQVPNYTIDHCLRIAAERGMSMPGTKE